MALEIVDLLSAARKYVVELEKEKKDAMEDRIKEIDKLLSDFVMEQGIYMQPKLIDQVEYLYNVANGPDKLPGRDAYERFAELKKILQEYY